MTESGTFLKSIADKIAAWDKELAQLKNRASEVTGDARNQYEKISEDVKKQAAQLKAKVDEYKNKSSSDLKTEAEQLMRVSSGKVAEGLKSLSKFFESQAGGGKSEPSSKPEDKQ